ncbi:DMT family transporter [Glycomyces salinus]|uniref:DMT family transporter n=1 Tax=Glycomyces salinus TaxID=980294 RepID=UPI001E52E405|nr:EamA family transporter [Glycomyces salinus]
MSTSIEVIAPVGASRAARRGLVFLTYTGLSWGTTGAVAELVYRASDFGPMALSFWRQLGGLVLLLAFLAVRPRASRPVRPLRRLRSRLPLLLGAGVGMAVFQAAYFVAVEATGVAVATIVTLGCGPILTAAGARVLLGERIGHGGLAAVAGALCGLGILVGWNAEGVATTAGITLSVISAAGYATVTLLGRLAGRGPVGEDPFALTVWSFGVGTAVLLPLALAEGIAPAGEGTAAAFGLVGYLAVFTTALAYPLYFAGTARVRAATASVMMLLEPASAAAIAVGFLDEPLTAATALGTLVLLGSIALLAVAESRRPALG